MDDFNDIRAEDMEDNVTQDLNDSSDEDMEDTATEEFDDDMLDTDTNHSRNILDDTLVNGIAINGEEDMGNIDFHNMAMSDLRKYHFQDVGVAFSFYNWYARLNGFSARKSKLRRNTEGEKIQQIFVCYREGFKTDRFAEDKIRQREARKDTRCGCEAKCHVHIDYDSGRWFFTYFNDVHNHKLVDEQFIGFLPGHRKMDENDISLMNEFRKSGIRTPQIFSTLANHYGGFENVGFLKHDMYNVIDKQRRSDGLDAKCALSYLRGLQKSDPKLYWNHTVDKQNRLERLFWCDGRSQLDYSVFGDVLAFDATYKKNRYSCPLVVFSGLNHHTQTIVFAAALVVHETEETYIWLLEQFLQAMSGKVPVGVITDGDVKMKNAISKVFPNAHHRLCAWHLIRNATCNVKNPRFTQLFKKCMLNDYEIDVFERKWCEMVNECGVEDNPWVLELYSKRHMWATAHIRGKFFAGFRTTSRCEGLHAHIGKFVDFRNNVTEFLQHFTQCTEYIRFKELEADFASMHGEQVLITPLPKLERSAANLFTRDVFFLVRDVMMKSLTNRVNECQETDTSLIFVVTKYPKHKSPWIVELYTDSMEFKCSCLRMESLGVPCEHIIAVMVAVNIVDIPKTLVLDRWSKSAKEGVMCQAAEHAGDWDSRMVCRFKALNLRCKEVNELAAKTPQDFQETYDFLTTQLERLKRKHAQQNEGEASVSDVGERNLRDPPIPRSKGFSGNGLFKRHTTKRKVHCGICGGLGHNKQTCPRRGNTMEDIEYHAYDLGNDDTHSFQFGVGSSMGL